MWEIPAIQRMLADPNIQKLVSCKCWANGWVQFKKILNFLISKDFSFKRFLSKSSLISVKLRALSEIESAIVVDLVSDPNLFKCIMDPDVRQHVFSVYRVLNYSQLNEYKRTGKVTFVPC